MQADTAMRPHQNQQQALKKGAVGPKAREFVQIAVVDVEEDLEPDEVEDEEELEGVDDLDFDSVDVENVPVLEEGADD